MGFIFVEEKTRQKLPLEGLGRRMLPEGFFNQMEPLLHTEFQRFADALTQPPCHGLRLNPLKQNANGKNAAELLSPLGGSSPVSFSGGGKSFAELTPVSWAADGYYYAPSSQPGRHPYQEAGVYYIQEPSAMAPGELLEARPGDRVLDLCAAPGGKSTQLAAALKGRGFLLANEIHPGRARILSENIERMGIGNALVTNETPQRLADAFPSYFDRILVDAPCSGEGMFRKNPDAWREWSLENLRLCEDRQDKILDCAANMLAPGGRMVYSTCTFNPGENEGSVERFLKRHPDFHLLPITKTPFLSALRTDLPRSNAGTECDGVPGWAGGDPALAGTLRLWPHRVKGEGHFAALLQRSGSPCAHPGGNGGHRSLSSRELADFSRFCEENLHLPEDGLAPGLCAAAGMGEDTFFHRFGDNLYLTPVTFPNLKGLKVLRPGLHLGQMKKDRFEPSHALALALSPQAVSRIWDLSSQSDFPDAYLRGETFPAEGEGGWHLICVDGFGTGWGKLSGGIMKNHYPKGLRILR